jgi:hypothetical protein
MLLICVVADWLPGYEIVVLLLLLLLFALLKCKLSKLVWILARLVAQLWLLFALLLGDDTNARFLLACFSNAFHRGSVWDSLCNAMLG